MSRGGTTVCVHLHLYWIVVLKISHNMAKLSICMGEEFGYLIDAITLTLLGSQLNERLT